MTSQAQQEIRRQAVTGGSSLGYSVGILFSVGIDKAHTLPDGFSCRHEKISGRVQTATAQDWSKSFTHIKHRAGAVSREGLVN